jgi:hypothetical protein
MMTRRSALFLALALVGGLAFAADWPLSPPRLAASFGSFGKGRVLVGVALAGEEGAVKAAEDGEIAFSAEEGTMPSGLPSALGSFLVVEHRGDMAAVYSHMAPGTLATRSRQVKAGDTLASPGRSGWIEGQGLVYQVFDRRAASWVNPYLLLPPLADEVPPVIRSLALTRGDKSFVIGAAASVPQGTYGISVDVADPSVAAWSSGPLAPYIIRLSVDGVQIVEEVFDVAKASGGRLRLFAQNPIAVDELRTAEGRYELTERLFTRGRTVIEVRVEDAAGNKRGGSWTVMVE